ERVIRGGPPSFWEIERSVPTTGVLFQRLTDRLDGGIPLARATFRTVAPSYPRNRDVVSLGAADLPARVARGVLAGSIDVDALQPTASDAPIDRPPGNAATARYLGRQARRVLRSQVHGVTVSDRWTVGVLGELDAPPVDLDRVTPRWVPELVDHGYLADPFPVVASDGVVILVEEFDTRTRRGIISALVADGDSWQLRSGVIAPEVHASYPCVVRDGDDVYCVPETAHLGRAEAWRCVEFPLRWERSGTVIDGLPIVDPTPFQHDDRWWLLGSRLDDEPNAKLFAWWSESLFGPWQPHSLNPVITDVT